MAKKLGLDLTPKRKKKPRKKDDENQEPVRYPNLIKNLRPIRPNVIWASDFTYIPFENSFVYLATVIDIYSREIVGFSVRADHSTDLVEEAFIDARQTAKTSPAIIHSDQGSEYKSARYAELLKNYKVKISMSKKASPWENGFQESYYSGFKFDLGPIDRFQSRGELIEAIYKTINYYNKDRIHSALRMSPKAFRHKYLKKLASIHKPKSLRYKLV